MSCMAGLRAGLYLQKTCSAEYVRKTTPIRTFIKSLTLSDIYYRIFWQHLLNYG